MLLCSAILEKEIFKKLKMIQLASVFDIFASRFKFQTCILNYFTSHA
jgi:hypothetical protein